MSAQTLARAKEIAEGLGDAEILVLHVNLLHAGHNTQEREIRRAAEPILDRMPFSVLTRRGFLVEETILNEARSVSADIVLVGANRAPKWRRLVSRLLPTQPKITEYLQNNVGPDITVEVVA